MYCDITMCTQFITSFRKITMKQTKKRICWILSIWNGCFIFLYLFVMNWVIQNKSSGWVRGKDLKINEAENEIQGRTRVLPAVRNRAKCEKMENALCTLENKVPFHNKPSKWSLSHRVRPSVILLFLELLKAHTIIIG